MVAQPAQRQLEHGLGPVQAAIVALELADLLSRGPAAQLGQLVLRQPVQAGEHAADLPRETRPRRRILIIAKNLAGDGFALDPLHDEAGAEIFVRRQHMHDARRRHARLIGKLHQLRFGAETGRPRRRGAIALRRAAQDRPDRPIGMLDVEAPGFLLAPPDSFAAPVTPVAPSHQRATLRESSASIICL